MANSFDSNFTRKLSKVILNKFESGRVITKNVNTQLLDGRYSGADTGEYVDFKRPTDYRSVRTSDGDVSGETKSDIITGKAFGQVQDYFTVFVDYQEADEAIKMAQKNELVDLPMMTRLVTDFELDFASFMMKNTNLLAGTVGTAVSTWDHVARAGATLNASGVPQDSPWCYAMNPFTQTNLASNQRSLGVNPEVGEAHRKATVTEDFAGMKVLAANTLASYTTHSGADRVGAVDTNPTVTYVGAKDTMTQDIAVTGFQANLQIRAGETVTVTGRNRLNLATRTAIVDEDGSNILFSGTVTTAVTLDGSGEGTITVAGAGIFESNGQYNTTDTAIVAGDVLTLGGAASTLIQPNLFWHKNAFSVGSVPIKKLHSTDTVFKTSDGLQIRVSKGVGFLENQQKVRIDFRPAYACLNPFFAGQGFGSS